MLSQYGIVLLFAIVAIGFVLVSLVAGSLIRPNKPDAAKNSTYECGEVPVGGAWVNFNMRFYVLALIFILFDVEIVFIFPVAVVYREWIAQNLGLFALIELLIFIVILFFALAYAWSKGDLNWVKSINQEKKQGQI